MVALGCDRGAQGQAPPSAARSSPPAPAAASSVAAAPPAPALFRVGEAARAADYTLTIRKVEECKVPRYFRPRPGHVRLGVELELEATTDKPVPVNGFYAKITDSDGVSHSPTLGGCEPALPTRRIAKPEKLSGWISYEVPEKATGFVLSYNPFIVGSMKQELRFRLPR